MTLCPAVFSRLVPALVTSSRGPDFSPAVRRAMSVDVTAALLLAGFTSLTAPYTGLILRRELGATPLQLSLLHSANAACLLLSFALARVVDVRRPLPYVIWPGFLARALFLLVPFIDSPWPFVGVLVGATLLGTVATPAQTALVQQVYPRAERGRALGTVRVVGGLAGLGLAVIAGHLQGWLSYRWLFPCAAVLGMAANLSLRRLPVPDAPAGTPGERPALRDAWAVIGGDAGYRRLLLASFVFGTGVWIQAPATPLLLADVLQVTTANVGVFTAAAAVAGLAGNALWGRLVDARSSLAALRAVYAVGALTPLFYFCSTSAWMLVAAAVAESLMATGLDLVWMLAVIDFAGPRRVAQYAAVAATLAGVRGVLGPLAGAVVIETLGVHAVYLVAATLMAAGAWLVSRQLAHAQKTPRYIEQPRQTEGGAPVLRASRKAS